MVTIMSIINIKVWVCTIVFLGLGAQSLNGQFIQIDTFIAEDIPAVDIKFTNNNAITIEHARIGVQVKNALTGFRVEDAEAQGFTVINAGNHGFAVSGSGAHGVAVSSAGEHGLWVGNADLDGLYVRDAGRYGVQVDDAVMDGYHVSDAGRNGLYVENAVLAGIRVENSRDGLIVGQTEREGVSVQGAGGSGFEVLNADGFGLVVSDAGSNGVQVIESGGHGINVAHAARSGIRVQDADEYSLEILGNRRGVASMENHIALIDNRNNEGGADVLALRVNTIGDVGDNSNYITFFESGPNNTIDNAIGAIEGNGSGGITFKTSGADFAETLSQMDTSESIRPGDVVGVYAGKISLQTQGADQVMVITDRPAILGNSSEQLENSSTANVSFVGQVPVNVYGPVRSGDWLVQSGNGDGVAKVIQLEDYNSDDQIIGQAWEDIRDNSIKRINVAVGVGHQKFQHFINKSLHDQLRSARKINQKLQDQIDDLRDLINSKL